MALGSSGRPGKERRRLTRRAFLTGAVTGGVGAWAATHLPRRIFGHDPQRPPQLYEYFLDNFWFESAGLYGEQINAPLKGSQRADVAILGGGYAGMSSAYNLIRRFPNKRIVLLEGACCGYGASGRNGGFADPGMPGLDTVYDEAGPSAARAYYDATYLGARQIRDFVVEHGIDCDLERNGNIALATEEEHVPALEAKQRRYREMGLEAELLDTEAVRRAVASERFVGGLRLPHHAILNPAKLARGIKRVIESLGVEVFERSKVMRITPGDPVHIETEFGELRAANAVVALNGYAPKLGLFRRRLIPLSNYIAATEPLSAMYLRLTVDDRIVFGGESAPYYYDSAPSSGNHKPALQKLKRSLVTTFPQLEGVRFTHGWGGTMGFTMDFMPSVGALDGQKNVFYAVGFNGEGVVMTQLAGMIVAQLVAGEESALTRLPIVGRRMPWVGPEPLRYLGVKATERILELASSNPVR
jgi:glycine/D-amino acid oxidase-like deaminating enzyme